VDLGQRIAGLVGGGPDPGQFDERRERIGHG
jgi:hypothetical protein